MQHSLSSNASKDANVSTTAKATDAHLDENEGTSRKRHVERPLTGLLNCYKNAFALGLGRMTAASCLSVSHVFKVGNRLNSYHIGIGSLRHEETVYKMPVSGFYTRCCALRSKSFIGPFSSSGTTADSIKIKTETGIRSAKRGQKVTTLNAKLRSVGAGIPPKVYRVSVFLLWYK